MVAKLRHCWIKQALAVNMVLKVVMDICSFNLSSRCGRIYVQILEYEKVAVVGTEGEREKGRKHILQRIQWRAICQSTKYFVKSSLTQISKEYSALNNDVCSAAAA